MLENISLLNKPWLREQNRDGIHIYVYIGKESRGKKQASHEGSITKVSVIILFIVIVILVLFVMLWGLVKGGWKPKSEACCIWKKATICWFILIIS